MTHTKAANRMIANDLNSAGFCTVMTNHYTVARLHRRVTIGEIEDVLFDCGYDECQFSTQKIGDAVIVKAITGDD